MTAFLRVDLDEAVNKIDDVRSLSLTIAMIDVSGHCLSAKKRHNSTDKKAGDKIKQELPLP